MPKTILITGGAGFIGSHIAHLLLAAGHRVRALDPLIAQVHGQVHGDPGSRPDYLHRDVELLRGDVRDPHAISRALTGVDAVYHFAARVGVGQSMYQIADYTSVNNGGTATLLEALAERPIERLIVASSMSVYGEGRYRDPEGAVVDDAARSPADLRARRWEPSDLRGRPLEPVPTPETKTPQLASIYALSKLDQEMLCMITARAYGIDAVALRFFNVYGPHQALSNPYTGVLAIFAARLLHGRRPILFEDGRQRRDFVHVSDVARACELALTSEHAPGKTLNIGSGEQRTIRSVAGRMAQAVGSPGIEPEVAGSCRVGDIRHCFADIGEAERVLGYRPHVRFDDGLTDLADWLSRQRAIDRVAEATRELRGRGLTL